MPNRIVREAILSSERVAALAWPEEVFYRRLMSIVDDYGRTEANPQLLRSKCYPLQTDTVRAADISRWMAACQKAGLILGYEVSGKQYLELLNFGQQQRSASKCPQPPASDINCLHPLADEHLVVSVSVSEGVVDSADAAKPSRKKAKTALPEDFAPNETGRRLCEQAAFNVEEEAQKFKNHHAAQGTLMADWQAGFRTWIDKAKGFRKPWQAPSNVTVPGKTERDPALVKIEEDSKKAAKPAPEVKARMDALLKGKVYS